MGENATSVNALLGLNDLSFLRFGSLKFLSIIFLIFKFLSWDGSWRNGMREITKGGGSQEATVWTPKRTPQHHPCHSKNKCVKLDWEQASTGFNTLSGKQTWGAFKTHYTLPLPAPGRVQTETVCWSSPLGALAVWHRLVAHSDPVQSYLHATVTSETAGRVRKSLRLTC